MKLGLEMSLQASVYTNTKSSIFEPIHGPETTLHRLSSYLFLYVGGYNFSLMSESWSTLYHIEVLKGL